MFEMLVNPKKVGKRTWVLFFVGLLYGSLALFFVQTIFAKDVVLSKYSGIILVTFSVLFSMPFVYYTIKLEESKILASDSPTSLMRKHWPAIKTFMWLFLGLLVAFSFWHIILPAPNTFKAQLETYCVINHPTNLEDCFATYGISEKVVSTAAATSTDRLLAIFSNNIYVLIFTLVFSLVFGAGVMFVLAWNASVIAVAVRIFTQSNILSLPKGIFRYMFHGFLEIGAYFTVALAGGLISVAVIKHEVRTPRFWEVLQDSLTLTIISIIVLAVAAVVEVYITPALF